MAQNNRQQTGTRFYFRIIEGDLRRKALATDESTTKRTTKEGAEVEEFTANSLSGILKSFELVTNEYQGKKMTDLVVTLYDIGETYIIQIPLESRYFSSFVVKLPNINLNETVELSSYKFTPKDRVKALTGISIKQNGQKVPDFYNKDNQLPGVPAFPMNGDDSEKKMWGLQQTIALKKLLAEQQERLREPVKEAQEEETGDLPF